MTSFLLWLWQFISLLVVLGAILAVIFVVYMLRELKKDKEENRKDD